jgi:O-antigen/teichoic acid export membrane protein
MNRAVSNVAWLLVERVAAMASAFVVSVVAARYLGPAGYGTYALAIAFVAMFLPFGTLGLNHLVTKDLVQEPASDDEIVSTAFWLRLLGGGVAAVAGAVCAWSTFEDVRVRAAVAVLGAAGALKVAGDVVEYLYYARGSTRPFATVRSAAGVLGAAVAIAAVLGGGGAVGMIVAKGVEYAFAAVVLMLVAYRGTRVRAFLKPSAERAKEFIRRSWPLMLSAIGASIYLKIDQVMLGWMRGTSEVGVYAVAAQLSEVWYFAPVAVASVMFPNLLRARALGGSHYAEKTQELYDLLGALGFWVAVVVQFLAAPVIALVFGEEFRDAALILQIHIWGGVFVSMRAALSKWLIAEGLFVFSLFSHGVGAIVNVLLNVVLISRFGGIGAAIATVISYMMASYGALFFLARTRESARMMSLALVHALTAPTWLPKRVSRLRSGSHA